jgi:hypothetical protein
VSSVASEKPCSRDAGDIRGFTNETFDKHWFCTGCVRRGRDDKSFVTINSPVNYYRKKHARCGGTHDPRTSEGRYDHWECGWCASLFPDAVVPRMPVHVSNCINGGRSSNACPVRFCYSDRIKLWVIYAFDPRHKLD